MAPTIANSIGVWDASKLDYVVTPNARVTQLTEMGGRNRHWRNSENFAVDHIIDRIVFNGRDNIQSSSVGLIPATADWTWVFRAAPTTGGGLYCQGNVATPHPGAVGLSAYTASNTIVHLGSVTGFDAVAITSSPLAASRQATLIVIRHGHRFSLRLNGAEVAYHEDDTGGPLRPIAQVGASGTAIGKNMAESGSTRFAGQLTRLGIWPWAMAGDDLAAAEYWAATGEFPTTGGTRQLLHSPHLLGSFP